MYGYIYKITNTLNSKIYVGKHKFPKAKLDPKYWGSGILISRAIASQGQDTFVRELLVTADSKEELNSLERLWIDKLDCRAPKGYNLTSGGDGAPDLDADARYRMGNGHRGIPRSEDLKQRTSQTLRGRSHSEDWVAKISASLKGKKPSPAALEGNVRRKRSSVWINDGAQERMLSSGDSLPEGWIRGRLRNPFPDQRGVPKTQAIIQKISARKRGSRWYNNGEVEIMLPMGAEPSQDYVPGRLKH